jgi:hypothetical protein
VLPLRYIHNNLKSRIGSRYVLCKILLFPSLCLEIENIEDGSVHPILTHFLDTITIHKLYNMNYYSLDISSLDTEIFKFGNNIYIFFVVYLTMLSVAQTITPKGGSVNE